MCRCSSDRGPNGGWRAATLNSTAARLHATHCEAACVIKRMQSAVHTEKTDGQTFCQDCIVKTGDSSPEVECMYFSNTHLLIIHIYAHCTTAFILIIEGRRRQGSVSVWANGLPPYPQISFSARFCLKVQLWRRLYREGYYPKVSMNPSFWLYSGFMVQ